MTNFFMGSSATGKRYMDEVGSGWIKSLVDPTAEHVILLSRLATVEVCSALARKQRLAQISLIEATQCKADFLLDVDRVYLAVPLEDAVLVRAQNLVDRHPLRTLDAIQLACALEAAAGLGEPLIFLSGDNLLLAAASAEGFSTDTPQAHP